MKGSSITPAAYYVQFLTMMFMSSCSTQKHNPLCSIIIMLMITTAIMPQFIFSVIFNDNINTVKLQPVVLFTPMLNVMVI